MLKFLLMNVGDLAVWGWYTKDGCMKVGYNNLTTNFRRCIKYLSQFVTERSAVTRTCVLFCQWEKLSLQMFNTIHI